MPSNRNGRKIDIKVLPGEATDGSGRICIHLFVADEKGPFTEPHVLYPKYKDGVRVKGKLEAKRTRGRLACDANRTVAPVTRNGITTLTMRSNDPRAITCIQCIASKDYIEKMKKMESPRDLAQAEKITTQ